MPSPLTNAQLMDFEKKVGFIASVWRSGYQEERIKVQDVCDELRRAWKEIEDLKTKIKREVPNG